MVEFASFLKRWWGEHISNNFALTGNWHPYDWSCQLFLQLWNEDRFLIEDTILAFRDFFSFFFFLLELELFNFWNGVDFRALSPFSELPHSSYPQGQENKYLSIASSYGLFFLKSYGHVCSPVPKSHGNWDKRTQESWREHILKQPYKTGTFSCIFYHHFACAGESGGEMRKGLILYVSS